MALVPVMQDGPVVRAEKVLPSRADRTQLGANSGPMPTYASVMADCDSGALCRVHVM